MILVQSSAAGGLFVKVSPSDSWKSLPPRSGGLLCFDIPSSAAKLTFTVASRFRKFALPNTAGIQPAAR